ncbi:MAG: hypothetical protein OXH56_00200 [Gemmatimonadetes bacterium]|nr:hypothetical protein [Gemmatimonadota bacterium]
MNESEKQAALEESKRRAKETEERKKRAIEDAYRLLEDPDASRMEIAGAMKELRLATTRIGPNIYGQLLGLNAQLYFALGARLEVKP